MSRLVKQRGMSEFEKKRKTKQKTNHRLTDGRVSLKKNLCQNGHNKVKEGQKIALLKFCGS